MLIDCHWELRYLIDVLSSSYNEKLLKYLPSFIIRKREGAVFDLVYRFVMDKVGPELSEVGRSQNCLSGLTSSEGKPANQVLCKVSMCTVKPVVTPNIEYKNGALRMKYRYCG